MSNMIDLARAEAITAGFSNQDILVVGDLMLDRYIYGSVERISPEAPVPVVRVTREKQMPGGAANVAVNICALGGRAVLAGVTGTDAAGDEMMAVLREAGIGEAGILRRADVRTIVKTRILAERQQVVRVDWENALALTAPVQEEFCRRVEQLAGSVSGVVIEDYSKGLIGQAVVDAVARAVRRRPVPVGLDPKDNTELRFEGLTLATPNCKEAHACAGLPVRSSIGGNPLTDPGLRRAAEVLLERWRPEQLIVTLGPQGMYLAGRNQPPQLIPTRAREVYDVSGAGDTVIATCLLALAAGATCREAAILGNCAAGVVVGKLGTASCSREELLESIARDEREGAL